MSSTSRADRLSRVSRFRDTNSTSSRTSASASTASNASQAELLNQILGVPSSSSFSASVASSSTCSATSFRSKDRLARFSKARAGTEEQARIGVLSEATQTQMGAGDETLRVDGKDLVKGSGQMSTSVPQAMAMDKAVEVHREEHIPRAVRHRYQHVNEAATGLEVTLDGDTSQQSLQVIRPGHNTWQSQQLVEPTATPTSTTTTSTATTIKEPPARNPPLTPSHWARLQPMGHFIQGVWNDFTNVFCILCKWFPFRLVRFLIALLCFIFALLLAIAFIGHSVKDNLCTALAQIWISPLPPSFCQQKTPPPPQGLRSLRHVEIGQVANAESNISTTHTWLAGSLQRMELDIKAYSG
ncbi:hypothetical protein ACHAPA_011951 [Fusarium lateritium]